MARVSPVEACMFCGQVPCQCNATKAKPKPKPRTKPKQAPISEPSLTVKETVEVLPEPAPVRQSMLERMRARAAAAPPPPPPIVRARPKIKPEPELEPWQMEMIPAIRLLSEQFTIVEEDLKPWRKYLDKPASTRERAQAWRRKVNGEGAVQKGGEEPS